MQSSRIPEDILANLKGMSGSETVVGDPVNAGPVTIVPVTKLIYGVGLSRTGLILGGLVSPTALVLIKGDDVRVYSLLGQQDQLDSLTGAAGAIVEETGHPDF